VFPVAMATIVTLRTGTDDQGFSLLELLLVLGLLTVSSLVVIPNINRGLREQMVRRTALELAAVARDLRTRALYHGAPQQLVLNLAENRYWIGRQREVQLPAGVKFGETEGGETLGRGERRFLFFPNGSASAGAITLTAEVSATAYAVRFEPLTGKVAVFPGDGS
jgi:general secretion pathway protein H